MPKPKQIQEANDARFKSNLQGVSELSARISKKFDYFDTTVAKVKSNFALLAMNSASNSRFREAAKGLYTNSSNSRRYSRVGKLSSTLKSLPKIQDKIVTLGVSKDFKNPELSRHEDSFFRKLGGSKKSIQMQMHTNSNEMVGKAHEANGSANTDSQSVLVKEKVELTHRSKENNMTPIQELFRVKNQKTPTTFPRSYLDLPESKLASERTVAVHSSSKISGQGVGPKSKFALETSPDLNITAKLSPVTARAEKLISNYESAKKQALSARKQLTNLPVLNSTLNPHLKGYLQLTGAAKPKTDFELNFEGTSELFDNKGRLLAGPQEPTRRISRVKKSTDTDSFRFKSDRDINT